MTRTIIARSKRLFYIIDSRFKLLKNRKKNQENLIKVLFVCQFLPAWDKIKNLYAEIAKDSRFSCLILCVPSNYLSNNNDTYEEILKQGYSKTSVINALEKSGSYLKLSSLSYDFIFYDRPYNYCLPKEYHARMAAKYGAVCFHPYALGLSKRLHEALMYDDFYLYVLNNSRSSKDINTNNVFSFIMSFR